MKPSTFKRKINWYPPYLGTGIRVIRVASDFRTIDVEMRLRWYNRNTIGTHFGGNLSTMIDPFYMLILMNILGRDYVVWDQSVTIDFLKPGRGRVKAHFHIPQSRVDEITAATTDGSKYRPTFEVNIIDEENEIVARVKKTLYIRRKQRDPQQQNTLKEEALS